MQNPQNRFCARIHSFSPSASSIGLCVFLKEKQNKNVKMLLTLEYIKKNKVVKYTDEFETSAIPHQDADK